MLRYHLDALGWWQFEEICQATLKAIFGPDVLSWGGRGDFGRDAYCAEPLELTKGVLSDGPFVFQVKFVEGANAAGAEPDKALLTSVASERRRIEARIHVGAWEMPQQYVLVTNVLLTPARRNAVEDEFAKALTNVSILSWGGQDVCDFLDNLPNIRLAFPQLLGIRDIKSLLATLLNKSTLERTKVQLRKAVELATVFAPTRAHDRALSILQRHHFVVLTGPPEMGKTTIGLMVCLALADDDWQVYDCVTPKDVLNSYDSDARQVFFVDDAFGSTEYRPDRARPWGDQLEHILLLMDEAHWLIWTSRPAPLNAALASINLQGRAEHFPSPGEVHVNASDLTLFEKAAILYRHCKSAELTDAAKRMVRGNLLNLISHRHFTPERIRRFVEHALPEIATKMDNPTAASLFAKELIRKELDQPTDRMRKSFDNLKDDEKTFLISMLDEDSGNASRPAVHRAFEKHIGDRSHASAEEIADVLAEHFIRRPGDDHGS